jgi:hypothetical protein
MEHLLNDFNAIASGSHQHSHEKLEFIIGTLSGWWFTNPSEKYEFVSWDDEIPN